MDSPLGILATLASKVTFASQQNAVPVVRGVRVTNAGESVEDLRLTMNADPAFLRPLTWRIDRIEANSAVELGVADVALKAGFLLGVQESVRGQARLVLRRDEVVLAQVEHPVEVLARNEWGGASMPELLAAFVMPNDPAVERVLKSASLVLARAGKRDALDG